MKVVFKHFSVYINIPSSFGFIQNGLTEIANKVATIPNFPYIPTIKIQDDWYTECKVNNEYWGSLKDYILQARSKLIHLLQQRLHYTEQRITNSKGNTKSTYESNDFYNKDENATNAEQNASTTSTVQVAYKDNELLIEEVTQLLDDLINYVENFLFTKYYQRRVITI